MIKKCIVCKKEIFRSDLRIRKGKRRIECVTCSKECSETYRRIYLYIYGIFRRKLKKNENQNKR